MKTMVHRTKLQRVLWEHDIWYQNVAKAAGVSRTTVYTLSRGIITDDAKDKVTEAVIRLAAEKGITLTEADLW